MSFYKVVVSFLKPLVKLFYRVTVIGKENEPDGNYMLCANHSSFVDPALTACFVKRQIRFIARKSLTQSGFLSWLFRNVGVITVDRDKVDLASLRTVISACRNGDSIAIFPQGTRVRRTAPKSEQAMSGAGLIAAQCKIPVLPVSIVTKRLMPGIFRKTYVIIGKPIMPEEYLGDGERTKKEISEYIFEKVCTPFETEFSKLKHYDKNC